MNLNFNHRVCLNTPKNQFGISSQKRNYSVEAICYYVESINYVESIDYYLEAIDYSVESILAGKKDFPYSKAFTSLPFINPA